MSFPENICYHPYRSKLYEVKPGLHKFGTDFGYGAWDQKYFQIFSNFSEFRSNKLLNLELRRGYHELKQDLNAQVEAYAFDFLFRAFQLEYPTLIQEHSIDTFSFVHTGDTYHKDTQSFHVNWDDGRKKLELQDRLLGILLQLPCDFAITENRDDKDYLSYLHVHAPSGWNPQDKIGKSFFDVHHEIPNAEKLVAASKSMVQAMIQQGPFVRFVWGVTWDSAWNQHPIRENIKKEANTFWIRVERQVTIPVAELQASLFLIQPFMIPFELLGREDCLAIKEALHSMLPSSRIYKGVHERFDELQNLLSEKIGQNARN